MVTQQEVTRGILTIGLPLFIFGLTIQKNSPRIANAITSTIGITASFIAINSFLTSGEAASMARLESQAQANIF